MPVLSRRTFAVLLSLPGAVLLSRAAVALDASVKIFVDAAARMRQDAIRTGDQAYGAVVVRGADIVGFGPSRVVLKRDDAAHAEREAIRDAQARLGADLSGCVMYSTSRPCSACEAAAAQAKISRMYFGADAADAGIPRGWR
jgi:tRNA(Arg) A34 adenosine deaminase TadA